MTSIFLSHNHRDKPFVRRLAADLGERGIETWVDEAEIFVGDSLIKKIAIGIQKVEYLGVILSANSVASEWVQREVEIALTEEIASKKVKVLPILIEDCDIPIFLRSKLYADFRDRSAYATSLSKLVRSVEHEDTRNKTASREVMQSRGFDLLSLLPGDEDRFYENDK